MADLTRKTLAKPLQIFVCMKNTWFALCLILITTTAFADQSPSEAWFYDVCAHQGRLTEMNKEILKNKGIAIGQRLIANFETETLALRARGQKLEATGGWRDQVKFQFDKALSAELDFLKVMKSVVSVDKKYSEADLTTHLSLSLSAFKSGTDVLYKNLVAEKPTPDPLIAKITAYDKILSECQEAIMAMTRGADPKSWLTKISTQLIPANLKLVSELDKEPPQVTVEGIRSSDLRGSLIALDQYMRACYEFGLQPDPLRAQVMAERGKALDNSQAWASPARMKAMQQRLRKPATVASVPAPAVSSGPPISAVAICRQSLERYPRVSRTMLDRCQKANIHAAETIDVYTSIYSGYMSASLFDTLLLIQTPSQRDCATQAAHKYNGQMTTKFLQTTCL